MRPPLRYARLPKFRRLLARKLLASILVPVLLLQPFIPPLRPSTSILCSLYLTNHRVVLHSQAVRPALKTLCMRPLHRYARSPKSLPYLAKKLLVFILPPALLLPPSLLPLRPSMFYLCYLNPSNHGIVLHSLVAQLDLKTLCMRPLHRYALSLRSLPYRARRSLLCTLVPALSSRLSTQQSRNSMSFSCGFYIY